MYKDIGNCVDIWLVEHQYVKINSLSESVHNTIPLYRRPRQTRRKIMKYSLNCHTVQLPRCCLVVYCLIAVIIDVVHVSSHIGGFTANTQFSTQESWALRLILLIISHPGVGLDISSSRF